MWRALFFLGGGGGVGGGAVPLLKGPVQPNSPCPDFLSSSKKRKEKKKKKSAAAAVSRHLNRAFAKRFSS